MGLPEKTSVDGGGVRPSIFEYFLNPFRQANFCQYYSETIMVRQVIFLGQLLMYNNVIFVHISFFLCLFVGTKPSAATLPSDPSVFHASDMSAKPMIFVAWDCCCSIGEIAPILWEHFALEHVAWLELG